MTQPGSVVIIVLTCTSVSDLLMILTARPHPGASTVVMRIILEWPYISLSFSAL